MTSTSANQIRHLEGTGWVSRTDTQYPVRNMEHKCGTGLAAADRDGSDNRRSEILTYFKNRVASQTRGETSETFWIRSRFSYLVVWSCLEIKERIISEDSSHVAWRNLISNTPSEPPAVSLAASVILENTMPQPACLLANLQVDSLCIIRRPD